MYEFGVSDHSVDKFTCGGDQLSFSYDLHVLFFGVRCLLWTDRLFSFAVGSERARENQEPEDRYSSTDFGLMSDTF